MNQQKELEVSPSEFIVGSGKDDEDDADDLPDETQICSCHNVSKGDIVEAIKEDECKSIGNVKSCTKAGTVSSPTVEGSERLFAKTRCFSSMYADYRIVII